jgi:adenylate kinase family enzyme
VRERLKVCNRQTAPVVDYYSARPTFRSIDGNQPPNVVAQEVEAALVDASRSATL